MTGGGQAAGVDEVRVVHAQLRGAGVHPLHKSVLAAREVLAERDGGVVAGDDAHGLDEVADAHLLPFFEPDLAAAHGRGVGGAGHEVVVGERSGVDRLHRQQQRHDLGDAGGLAGRVLVLGIEHRAGLLFHEDGGRRADLQCAHRNAEQRSEDQQGKKAFHGDPSEVGLRHFMSGGRKSYRFRLANRVKVCYHTSCN